MRGPPWTTKMLYTIVDVLDEIAAETGKTVPQIGAQLVTRSPDGVVRDHRSQAEGTSRYPASVVRIQPPVGCVK